MQDDGKQTARCHKQQPEAKQRDASLCRIASKAALHPTTPLNCALGEDTDNRQQTALPRGSRLKPQSSSKPFCNSAIFRPCVSNTK